MFWFSIRNMSALLKTTAFQMLAQVAKLALEEKHWPIVISLSQTWPKCCHVWDRTAANWTRVSLQSLVSAVNRTSNSPSTYLWFFFVRLQVRSPVSIQGLNPDYKAPPTNGKWVGWAGFNIYCQVFQQKCWEYFGFGFWFSNQTKSQFLPFKNIKASACFTSGHHVE